MMEVKTALFITKGKERMVVSERQLHALLDEGIVIEKNGSYVIEEDDWTFDDCQQYLTERDIT